MDVILSQEPVGHGACCGRVEYSIGKYSIVYLNLSQVHNVQSNVIKRIINNTVTPFKCELCYYTFEIQ